MVSNEKKDHPEKLKALEAVRPVSMVMVREARESDAHAVLRFKRKVFVETNNLLQTMDDYDYDTEEERYLIRRYRHLDNCGLYLALMGRDIVGFLTLQGGALQRNRHVAQLGLAVTRDHWGKGIGKQLMEQAVAWAGGHRQIRKISLLVYDDNDRAIKLYERFGFKQEGCLEKEVFLVESGEYENLVAMGLCF